MACPFCKQEDLGVILRTEHFYAIYDRAPVTKGHILIISNKHLENIRYLNEPEWRDLLKMLLLVWEHIEDYFKVVEFNIGINSGRVAGQTVMHFHVHVFPRRQGDVEGDPRGGIRHFMKPLVALLPDD